MAHRLPVSSSHRSQRWKCGLGALSFPRLLAGHDSMRLFAKDTIRLAAGYSKPQALAQHAACARVCTCSFSWIFLVCDFTVS